MRKNVLQTILSVLILVLSFSLTAAAEADTAGNILVIDRDESAVEVDRDLYWAGNSRAFSGYTIGKSLIAAGRDVTISDSKAGGSLRVGSYTLLGDDLEVADNITAAAYSIQLTDVKAAGVYLAANTVTFSGEADSAAFFGSSVNLNGTFHGDVTVYGNSVTFGPELVVEGKLTVNSETEPVLPKTAQVGNYEFIAPEHQEEETATPEKRSSGGFGKFVKGLLGVLLLTALICLLLGYDEMVKPAVMLKARTLPMLGTGLAALFVIPGIIVILLFIWIGGPSAGLIAILYALVCLHAVVYAGATLANVLMPKITDNNILNNFWIRSLIGAVIFWLLRKIPVIGVVILIGSIIYTLGYFVQSVFLRLRGPVARAPKGSADKAADILLTDDALEPVKKKAGQYVDPVLAESEELTASHADFVSSVDAARSAAAAVTEASQEEVPEEAEAEAPADQETEPAEETAPAEETPSAPEQDIEDGSRPE